MPSKYLIGKPAIDRALGDIATKQIPFAVALGLTRTAQNVQKELTAELPRRLDRPTPFTMRAFKIKIATKRYQSALVFTRPAQEEYLKPQVYGGTRRPKRTAIVVPFSTRLNKYGNLTRNKVKTLLAKKNTFSGVVKGVPGIWQRPRRLKSGRYKGSPKLLIAYEKKVTYRPRFPFREVARRTAMERIVPNIVKAARFAMKTAR